MIGLSQWKTCSRMAHEEGIAWWDDNDKEDLLWIWCIISGIGECSKQLNSAVLPEQLQYDMNCYLSSCFEDCRGGRASSTTTLADPLRTSSPSLAVPASWFEIWMRLQWPAICWGTESSMRSALEPSRFEWRVTRRTTSPSYYDAWQMARSSTQLLPSNGRHCLKVQNCH